MKNTTERTTVLLIDDEEPLLDSLQEAVERAGYACLRATLPEVAVKILDRTPEIDVIVCDIRMPGMDGIELTRTVRERYHDRMWLQVIFLTGHATVDNSINALRLQAVDFLHKPVRKVELLETIDRARLKAINIRESMHLKQEGRARLSRLMVEAKYLSNVLGISPLQEPALTPETTPTPVDMLDARRMLELLKSRDIKTRYFSDKLFADPAWLMLLDLMEQHLMNKAVSVSGICIVAGVPAATAARRLEEMEQSGFVQRHIDKHDKRRQIVSLTPRSIDLITRYLTALHNQMK